MRAMYLWAITQPDPVEQAFRGVLGVGAPQAPRTRFDCLQRAGRFRLKSQRKCLPRGSAASAISPHLEASQ